MKGKELVKRLLDAKLLSRAARLVGLLVATLVFLAGGGVVLAQTGGNNVTFVKEADPPDGSNFVLDAPLTPLGSFGSMGDEEGEFDSPEGVAIGRDGLIIVADYQNHRIQQFDAAGNFVRMWGKGVNGGGDAETCTAGCSVGLEGDRAGEFSNPAGVAVGPDGSIYVADSGNLRIQQFTADGQFVRAWGQDVVVGGSTGFEICEPPATCQAGDDDGIAGAFNIPSGLRDRL
jgi:DNA-binding beta-propeller fold protein YncE